MKAGALGYLTKESAPDLLISAIRKVARGGVYISSGAAERMAIELYGNNDANSTYIAFRPGIPGIQDDRIRHAD